MTAFTKVGAYEIFTQSQRFAGNAKAPSWPGAPPRTKFPAALEQPRPALYANHEKGREHTMDHGSYPDSYIADILNGAKSFALVGASANTVRPSHFVLKYLLAKGYRVFPINPGLAGGEILGQKVAANIAGLEEPVDVVDIFRNSEAALGVVKEALEHKDRLGIKAIWMQLGVHNDEAARLAEEAGLKVVMNRCPKIEYGRLSGEIGWAGVSSGMISSRKPVMLGKGYQQLSIRKDEA